MDLTEDIRYKLYHLIRGNITERKKSIVDQTSLEMGDLVAAWITGRLDKSILKISRSSSYSDQVYYLQNFAFSKKELEIEDNEIFDKYCKISKQCYFNISINLHNKKIPYFPWMRDFNKSPKNFINSIQEEVMFRELQNLALRCYIEDFKLKEFDHTYSGEGTGWGYNPAYYFLKPQGIESVEDLRDKFPEWYDKFYIPEFLIDSSERPNTAGWEGLIEVLKK